MRTRKKTVQDICSKKRRKEIFCQIWCFNELCTIYALGEVELVCATKVRNLIFTLNARQVIFFAKYMLCHFSMVSFSYSFYLIINWYTNRSYSYVLNMLPLEICLDRQYSYFHSNFFGLRCLPLPYNVYIPYLWHFWNWLFSSSGFKPRISQSKWEFVNKTLCIRPFDHKDPPHKI